MPRTRLPVTMANWWRIGIPSSPIAEIRKGGVRELRAETIRRAGRQNGPVPDGERPRVAAVHRHDSRAVRTSMGGG